MTERIVVVPWVEGCRSKCQWGSYTAERVRFTCEQAMKAAPDLPIFVLTPHVDADLGPFGVIGCRKFLDRTKLIECGVMAGVYHPELDHLDIDMVTADTLVLRDPRMVMGGAWTAPRQHLPQRPYGDWFCHVPANHRVRDLQYHGFTRHPDRQVKFDHWHYSHAHVERVTPRVIEPPVTINGEWIVRGWKPWCQPLTAQTAAVHPDGGVKWPELADRHEYFHGLREVFARRATEEETARQCAAVAAVADVPKEIA